MPHSRPFSLSQNAFYHNPTKYIYIAEPTHGNWSYLDVYSIFVNPWQPCLPTLVPNPSYPHYPVTLGAQAFCSNCCPARSVVKEIHLKDGRVDQSATATALHRVQWEGRIGTNFILGAGEPFNTNSRWQDAAGNWSCMCHAAWSHDDCRGPHQRYSVGWRDQELREFFITLNLTGTRVVSVLKPLLNLLATLHVYVTFIIFLETNLFSFHENPLSKFDSVWG